MKTNLEFSRQVDVVQVYRSRTESNNLLGQITETGKKYLNIPKIKTHSLGARY